MEVRANEALARIAGRRLHRFVPAAAPGRRPGDRLRTVVVAASAATACPEPVEGPAPALARVEK